MAFSSRVPGARAIAAKNMACVKDILGFVR
jgi:hypothetical protein